MSNKIRLSIILPVYNVEIWLGRCLDSQFNQGLFEDEFEVIIVNDGSEDNSLELANDFAAKHSNVKVISRENGGLSAARNTGLEHAHGNYIWFVDSDDFIEPNSIKPILEYAELNELDMMCFFFQLAFEDGHTEKYFYRPKHENEIFSGDEFVSKTGFIMSPWASIYKKSFLDNNSLRYMEKILHEDEEFSPRAQFLAKRIAHTDTIVYNYFQRTGSIMKSSRSKERVKSFLSICDSLYDFVQRNVNPDSNASDFFKGRIFFCFSQALSHLADSEISDLQLFKSKPYYPLATPKGLKKSLKLKLAFINHFPWLYIKTLRLKKKL